jgi:hypothetical protein
MNTETEPLRELRNRTHKCLNPSCTCCLCVALNETDKRIDALKAEANKDIAALKEDVKALSERYYALLDRLESAKDD